MLQLPLLHTATAIFIYFILNPFLFVFLYRVCRAPFPQSKKLSESSQWSTKQRSSSSQRQAAEQVHPPNSDAGPGHTTSARVGKPQNILPVVLCYPVNIRHQEGDKGHNSIAKPSMGTGCCVVVSERMCYGWLERKKWKPDGGQQQQSEVWLRSLFTTAQQLRGQRITIRFSDKKC